MTHGLWVEFFIAVSPTVQLIQTSAISLHTNDQSRDLYLDVFSCKEFKEEDVLKVVNEFFAPETTTPHMVYRK